LLRVQTWTLGFNHDVSSSVPPRTTRIMSGVAALRALGLPNTHVPQPGQINRVLTRPPSVTPPGAVRGSLPVDRNAEAGTTTPIENALLVMRWQSVQWQAYTLSGAAVIS